MTKELKDLAWACLPREFKEEVKKEYKIYSEGFRTVSAGAGKWELRGCYRELEGLFGVHNLTSDAEGDEMLTCVKDQAVKLYNIANKAYAINGDKYYQGYMNAMIDLFGSKCLPDGLNADNFAKSEPKFHKGDKVEVINYDFGLPSLSRCVHEVFTVSDAKYNANQWMYKLETNKWLFNERDYLESIQWCEHFLKAYKEPKPSELKEEADEHFDTIVKGGFRNERRLNIATQITASIYANDEIASRFESIEALVRKALDIADTLIAECEKGDNQ